MPMHKFGRLLIVDDEIELTTALCDGLKKRGYEATGVTCGNDGLEAIKSGSFDLLLTDLMMPDLNGIALLKTAIEIDPHIIGIIMTGQGTVQTAVEAMRIGAYDYVLKPFKLDKLLPVLTRALEVRRLRLDNVQLRETLAIYELCQAIAHTLDMDTLLNKTAEAVLQQLEADEVSIMLPAKESDELYVATVRGESRDKILGSRIPLSRGIADWLAQHNEILSIEGADSRCTATHPGANIGASISMPMLIGDKLLGVLNAANKSRRPFTLGQVKGLSILAGTAAAAFESVGLYTQVRQAEEKCRSRGSPCMSV
jgi:DNA-binding response OmpR family regulator